MLPPGDLALWNVANSHLGVTGMTPISMVCRCMMCDDTMHL